MVKKSMTKKKAAPKKAKAKNGKVTLNFKVSPVEAKQIKAKADRLCNGNVTALVRMAVPAWMPSAKAKDLLKFRASTRK